MLGPAHHDSSLDDVAPLLVRNLADLGVFYLVDSDGELRRAAAATRDPAQAVDRGRHHGPTDDGARPITSQDRSFAIESP